MKIFLQIRRWRYFALVMLAPCAFAAFWEHKLRADEIVQLSDSYAKVLAPGLTQVRVHAWVYERERRPGALGLFAKYLGLDTDSLSPVEQKNFATRTQLFFVDVQKNKRLLVSSEDTSSVSPAFTVSPAFVQLTKTDSFGAVSQLITLPQKDPSAAWLNYSVQGPVAKFTGRALLVPERGTSIVSDIDDTIRITNVLDRHEMLMNTFVRPLQAVPGMQALYAKAAAVTNVRVHYVSNAPFALYPLVNQFLIDAQFPAGSMHLRAVRFKTSIWNAVFHPNHVNTHKTNVIETLLGDFPERAFVLIGDTGELDPEIYAAIARAHPSQICMVLLHNVSQDLTFGQRLTTAMHGLPAAKWRLFRDAAELKASELACQPGSPEASK
jgi:hypothetical protein